MKAYKTNGVIIALTLLLINLIHAQKESDTDATMRKYANYYQLEQESIFTQINKTAYMANEQLWFKTYIYGIKNQTPYESTSNLNAIIYNSEGTPIKSKIFYASGGSTNGNFAIDAALPPGTYYLKTTTTYMKNFDSDRSYLNKFVVLDNTKAIKQATKSAEATAYDLQLLPEGGHLLTDVTNTIGFKITDQNGNSPIIKEGVIKNSAGDALVTTKSNDFGLGKLKLLITPNQTYTFEATLANGQVVSQPLPKADKTGVTINVENNFNDLYFVTIATNNNTIQQLANTHYALLIEKEGLVKKVDISFKANTLTYQLPIKKDYLYTGVNILTLINNEGNPIAERVIYNNHNEKVTHVKIGTIKPSKDSLAITLKKTVQDSTFLNISVSALPSETLAYNAQNNIYAAYILTPFVKGYIEKPDYYFSNTSRRTMYDLDLLLLTQGWSKYNWEKIFKGKAESVYPFEVGFTITGNLEKNYKYNPNNMVYIMSKENNIFKDIPVNENNTFLLQNVYIQDSTNIAVTFINKKSKNKKPKLNYTISPNLAPENLNLTNLAKQPEAIASNTNSTTTTNRPLIAPSTIQLDSVVLSTRKKPEEKPKHKPLGNAKTINIKNTAPSILVTDLISQHGFKVINTMGKVSITTQVVTSISASQVPMVFFNDVPLTDFSSLSYLRVSDIEELYIDKFSPIYGSRGSNGAIHIYSKSDFGQRPQEDIFNAKKVHTGYNKQKQYYSPQYDKTQYETFANYGALNWVPYVLTNTNGEYQLTIPKYYNAINLYIEGMDTSGKLIHDVLTIEP